MKAMNLKLLVVVVSLPLLLTACTGGEYTDLQEFMQEVKSRPKKHIEPIPSYPPYKSFTYTAPAMRSPFDKPVAIKEISRLYGPVSAVKPDPDRPKEYLERFGIEALGMVGHIQKSGVMYALINDGEGSVHPVTIGNYVGRNHGKITELKETEMSVVEIVPSGSDNWVERPRTVKLLEAK